MKSALASLWYVSDIGTVGLMSEFYRHLRSAPIKAEALRQAQLAMIAGRVRTEGGQLFGTGERGVPLPPQLAKLPSETFSHPYYWASFTLIGTPW
ncbi:MAG: CHAT domain-containing protein [Oscillatoria princeps RMCB-10]|nr:CHAT domain-containing protein [Oscillatoria princeps RMCB-10]